jgi:hypothetical protein
MGLIKKILPFLLLVILFLISAQVRTEENDERVKLLEQEKFLKDRIESLKREQDFMLFEKTLYSNDSKYLVLYLSEGKGELKYKGRVLRNFRVTSSRKNHQKIVHGPVTLTKKIDAAKGPASLVFGKSFVLHKKSSSAAAVNAVPRISLFNKDFTAIYYAVDQGTKAYLFP